MKGKEYRTPVQNLTQMKRSMKQAVTYVPDEMLRDDWLNFEICLNAFISQSGGHIYNSGIRIKTVIKSFVIS